MTAQNDLQTLFQMLSFKRPAASQTEAEFINRFIRPLGAKVDKFGNMHLTIGENPTVLWSSHTDSVHRSEGQQRVRLNGNFVELAPDSKSNCLGADDAAGVWVMMGMVEAKVPGRYIFHFGEEKGGVGSRALARETPDVLKDIQAAVAFDRRGTHSVITHQGHRTCSDAFGKSLTDQLPGYKLDQGGTFTDTKVYADQVPECTNVSVGYYNEHSSSERLDVAHLVKLREAMITIDTSRFIIERDPKRPSYPVPDWSSGHSKIPWRASSLFDDFDLEDERKARTPRTIAELLQRYPMTCGAVLEESGFTFADLESVVLERMEQFRPPLRKAS